jgi:hypothetical protein
LSRVHGLLSHNEFIEVQDRAADDDPGRQLRDYSVQVFLLGAALNEVRLAERQETADRRRTPDRRRTEPDMPPRAAPEPG